jgi:hypothetical protein
MRLDDALRHPTTHAALTDVTPDQHHDRPANTEVSNTSLAIAPLPGGPGVWDIAVPVDARVVMFSLRSNRTITPEGGGKAGVLGIATRSQSEASTASLGGHSIFTEASYNAIFTKVAGAMVLSHKVFSSTGIDVALTDAYLVLTAPDTRVLRTTWTNYGAAVATLNCWGEVQVIG